MTKEVSTISQIKRVRSKLNGLDTAEAHASDPVVIEDIKIRREELKEELDKLQSMVKET